MLLVWEGTLEVCHPFSDKFSEWFLDIFFIGPGLFLFFFNLYHMWLLLF